MQLGRARGTCWSRPDGHARVSHGDQFNKKGLLIVRLNFDFFFFAMLGLFCRKGSSLALENGCCSLIVVSRLLVAVASLVEHRL